MGQANSRSELLWQMSGYGNKEKVKAILAEGVADPNWVSLDDNSTSLMVAAGSKKGGVELIRLLLSAGADVACKDNRDNAALHHAAMRGDVAVIKALVEAGSDIDAQNGKGWTPLMNACYWCKPDAAAAFIELGAKVDLLNNEKRSALHELCRSPFELYTCNVGEEEDAEDEEEEEPSVSPSGDAPRLTWEERRAARERKERRAAERRARLEAMKPALMLRREEELAEMACLLIEAGCDVDRRSQSYGEEDFTPLLYAAFHNHAEVALVLTQCEHNVNVNYQGGENQWTALHWAADRGNAEMVQLLLDAGADSWTRGARGELASDRANDDQIRTLLLNAQNKTPEAAVDNITNTATVSASTYAPRIHDAADRAVETILETAAAAASPPSANLISSTALERCLDAPTVLVTAGDVVEPSSNVDVELDLTPLRLTS